jgi:hypothetical protein
LKDYKLINKLEKKFTNEATMTIQSMANEHSELGNRTAIKFDEELLTTDNFPKGGRYDERFWGMYNYLIPTPATLKITEKK